MNTIGEKISNLPFGKMQIVNELLAFDGMPLVLHYSTERKEDVLAYWVDFNSTATRWLFTKISKDELFRYLKGIIPLKKVFQEIKSEYVFFADIDQQNKINDARIISSYLIPDEYFAGEGSFYQDGLSDFYLDYLKDFEYSITT